MTAQLIDGKAIAFQIRESIKQEVTSIHDKLGKRPGLAVVLVGDDPSSKVYVNMKKKACIEAGIYSEEHILSKSTNQEELIKLIEKLNDTPEIHGILVQLPLPDHINEDVILNAIDPLKDVDGFHPINTGSLMIGNPNFVPCTPAGVIKLIESTGIDIKGKRAVVVGRSNIVGKPVSLLLLENHATVTICHSRTKDLDTECKNADILVVAIGRSEMISGDMIKPGAIVIDVGVNRTEKGLVGDVKFEEAKNIASHITPVPGGVGPMTIAMLMQNTLRALKLSI